MPGINQIQIGGTIYDLKDNAAARASDVQRLFDLIDSGASLVAYPIIWRLGTSYSIISPTRLTNYYFANESGLTFLLNSEGQPETDLRIKYNGVDITQDMISGGMFTEPEQGKVQLVLEDPGAYEIVNISEVGI